MMTNQTSPPAERIIPLSRDDLLRTIRYHRISLLSHRWQMSPATEQLEKQTVQALEHYRDLCDCIDNREPSPDPITFELSLTPAKSTDQQEQPE